MKISEFGNKESNIVLVEIMNENQLDLDSSFYHICVEIEDWNQELSPWCAPSVFGKGSFGNGAKATLSEILKHCKDLCKTYYLIGYSLAGLFALWSSYQCDVFSGVACVSGSLWFPEFIDYMKNNTIHTKYVYLSLGKKETKTRNKVMSKVGDCTIDAYEILNKQINCVFEWNEGNHFNDVDARLKRGIDWLIKIEGN